MSDAFSHVIEIPSQPPLGTRVVRSAASGIVLTLATNVFLFLGQLLIPRALSREGYAQFTVSISFVALLALVADLGMTPLFTRLFAKAEEEVLEGHVDRRGGILGAALVLRITMSVVTSVLVLVVGNGLYSASMLDNMAILLTTLIISSRLPIIRAAIESILRGQRKYHLVALFALPDAIVFALLLFISRNTLTLTGALWVYSLSNLPGFLLLLVWVGRWLRREQVQIRIDIRIILTLVREAVPLILWTAFLTVHAQIDNLFLDKLSTAFEVSSYSASVRVLTAALPIPMVLASVIGPELTRLLHRGDSERSQQLVLTALRILLVGSAAIALVLMVGSESITVLLLSAKYMSIAPLLKWMGWMLIPIFVGTLLTETSVAGGNYWYSTVYAFVLMVVVIVCDLLLIPSMGALGAIISKFTAVFVGCIVFVTLLRKADFFAVRKFASTLFRSFLAIVVAILALLASKQLFRSEMLALIATIGTFTFMVYSTKLLTQHDLRLAFSKLRNSGK